MRNRDKAKIKKTPNGSIIGNGVVSSKLGYMTSMGFRKCKTSMN